MKQQNKGEEVKRIKKPENSFQYYTIFMRVNI